VFVTLLWKWSCCYELYTDRYITTVVFSCGLALKVVEHCWRGVYNNNWFTYAVDILWPSLITSVEIYSSTCCIDSLNASQLPLWNQVSCLTVLSNLSQYYCYSHCVLVSLSCDGWEWSHDVKGWLQPSHSFCDAAVMWQSPVWSHDIWKQCTLTLMKAPWMSIILRRNAISPRSINAICKAHIGPMPC